MKRFLTPCLFLALVAFASTSCQSAKYGIVTVGLETELVSIVRTEEGTVQATWRMLNPNIAFYLISQTKHKIYLNGILVGTTAENEPFGVPPQSSTDRTSNLSLNNTASEHALAQALAAGSASYRLESQITAKLYEDNTSRNTVTKSGTVPVTGKK